MRPGPSFHLATDLARSGRHPRICTIATATGDDSARLAAVHNAFSKLGMVSSHLALFPMPNVPDIREHLLAQDVIWVSGGSTANLLALWRLHGLDFVLRECWEAGVVLAGVSAGSLCWHVGGTTDSFGPDLRAVTDGLGFLPYSNSPHHDAEAQRRPLIHRLIAEGTLPGRLRHRERDRTRLLRHRAPGGRSPRCPVSRPTRCVGAGTRSSRAPCRPGCSEDQLRLPEPAPARETAIAQFVIRP